MVAVDGSKGAITQIVSRLAKYPLQLLNGSSYAAGAARLLTEPLTLV
jgi:hypothetical protein